MYSLLLLIVLIFSFITGSVWISFISYALYLLVYTRFALFLVTVLLDGYIGAFYEIPWLSLITGLLLVLVAISKKRLMLYTDQNEVVS